MNTVAQEVEHEIEIKRSRFIAVVWKVESEKTFKERLETLKRQHPAANHHVYAYAIRETDGRLCIRFNDDGEPHSSAGKPVLSAIQGRGLINTAVVVVRYFGGTKLGVGGLVRAYGGAASEALQQAGQSTLMKTLRHRVQVSYRDLQEQERSIHNLGGRIVQRIFEDQVTLEYETDEPAS